MIQVRSKAHPVESPNPKAGGVGTGKGNEVDCVTDGVPEPVGEQIGRPHLFNRRLVGFSPAVVLETLGVDGKKLSGGSPEGAQVRAGLERECGGAAADELATGYVVAQGSRG